MDFTYEMLATVAGCSAFTVIVLQVLWHTVQPDPAFKDRFGPVVAIAVAILTALGASLVIGGDPTGAILTGITAGFAAMGLHDLGDSVGLPV
jgi:hypothetical protein